MVKLFLCLGLWAIVYYIGWGLFLSVAYLARQLKYRKRGKKHGKSY